MSSINPVILLPGALADRGEAIGAAFAGSLALGAGQFCTNPGLVLAIDSPALEAFVAGASKAVSATQPATMLTPGIHKAYTQGVAALNSNAAVKPVAKGVEAEGFKGQAAFFSTDAKGLHGRPFDAGRGVRRRVPCWSAARTWNRWSR